MELPLPQTGMLTYEPSGSRMRQHHRVETECHNTSRLLATIPGSPYHQVPECDFPGSSDLFPTLEFGSFAHIGGCIITEPATSAGTRDRLFLAEKSCKADAVDLFVSIPCGLGRALFTRDQQGQR